ncbi:head-tail adaptor protein [Clostridium botulinum]|uniref:phage head closure protein n=1 Tax=Clostridium botulinum TaxID=1491 RepID=UPI000773A6F3|nr:phage head closure protein [Clostridium botulinum]NFE93710.1 head-tail adaptor protein [Clostridium botulinum]NFL38460.1 head-tail adaptor protein [Clostridium botulinum]NFL65900.1 head-tail adaptor protein [Clostridium botulinum]NFN08297.1 head-tail adaptor protein [Clostridium botulinum]NFN18478.1 head-tail adaptor protein [Clostridium botulinum]
MYVIDPGDFKHKIEIRRYSKNGKDEDDIPTEKYEAIVKTRAKIINTSGKEISINNGIASKKTKIFRIRFPKGIEITNNDKLLYNKKMYDIIYPSDIEDLHIYLEIVCEIIE